MIKLLSVYLRFLRREWKNGEQPLTPLKWLCTLYSRVVKATNEATLKTEIFNPEIGAEDLEIFQIIYD